jgi:hypothetical protein
LDEVGGALRAGDSSVISGILKSHGRGNVDDEHEVASFLGFDFRHLGSMGLGLNEQQADEGRCKSGEREDSQDGSEVSEWREFAIGSEGQMLGFSDSKGVEGLRASREN